MIDEAKKERLKKMGIRDSKLLTPERRRELSPKIKKMADGFSVSVVAVEEIDSHVNERGLNRLEIKKMQEIINQLNPDLAVVDSPERNTKAFRKKILSGLRTECDVIAENYADKNHIEVGAASIIAKVTRDSEIKKLHKQYGNFGSGYTSDPETVGFLKDWLKKNKQFPPFVRKSWITAQVMLTEKQQMKIDRCVK